MDAVEPQGPGEAFVVKQKTSENAMGTWRQGLVDEHESASLDSLLEIDPTETVVVPESGDGSWWCCGSWGDDPEG